MCMPFVNSVRYPLLVQIGLRIANIQTYEPSASSNQEEVYSIPPKSRFDTVKVLRPELYYGELTKSPEKSGIGKHHRRRI
ncbi:hypothetical protein JCM39068_05240 [Desulfocastanea catecholica]